MQAMEEMKEIADLELAGPEHYPPEWADTTSTSIDLVPFTPSPSRQLASVLVA